ncbi:MAG: PHP domain-containing protein, partial [Phycisphaerales bacterium]|nr:PHP domain-containing protein [Phycisphaerales bacterium]
MRKGRRDIGTKGHRDEGTEGQRGGRRCGCAVPVNGIGHVGCRPGGYAELRCKSNFSFLRGASHPEELVERAAALGYAALAITDVNTLAGVVRMHCATREHGMKLIVGAEIAVTDARPIALYATDRASYGRLSRLITRGKMRCAKGECAITFDDVAELSEGLMGVVFLG